MSEGYYPKYYLKKRQRDNAYRKIWQWIVGILVIGVGIVVGVVVFNQFSPSKWAAARPADLADMKEQLETEQRVSDAQDEQQQAVNDAEPQAAVTFEGKLSELEYTASLPPVHVGVDKGTADQSRDPHEVNDPATGADSEETPASDVPEPAPPPPPAVETPAGSAAVAQPKPEDKPPVVKAEVKKPEPVREEKPSEDEKQEPVPVKKAMYHVYAGIYRDRDSAVASKKDLNVLGFPGTIKENGGDYMVQVAAVETKDEATVLEQRLKQNGFAQPFVVFSSK